MAEVVIKVDNLSKQYRLGEVTTGTLTHDVNRWWHRIRGKEDPYLKIGEENDRTKKGSSEYVWALQNINFEVKQGEVVGIIGRNGAGKSTLLKILSRTTTPTTGEVKMKGRIASLLEVGTGFHPELSGRDNIFLNGAILGMQKQEIKRKLDAIIDFSGIERYVDTPVKRYSSGMYVRLAFAVAAHLESEILIVDEVLAVGDAEFQKKCLSKMGAVSKGEGRTVLFVSHNMAAIQSLCTTGLYLKNGTVVKSGNLENTISEYLTNIKSNSSKNISDISQRKGNGIVKIRNVAGINSDDEETDRFLAGDLMRLQLSFDCAQPIENNASKIDIGINTQLNERVAWISTSLFQSKVDFSNDLAFNIQKLSLTPGFYNINIYCEVNGEVADWIENVFQFEIEQSDYYSTGKIIPRGQGYLMLDYNTTVTQ